MSLYNTLIHILNLCHVLKWNMKFHTYENASYFLTLHPKIIWETRVSIHTSSTKEMLALYPFLNHPSSIFIWNISTTNQFSQCIYAYPRNININYLYMSYEYSSHIPLTYMNLYLLLKAVACMLLSFKATCTFNVDIFAGMRSPVPTPNNIYSVSCIS